MLGGRIAERAKQSASLVKSLICTVYWLWLAYIILFKVNLPHMATNHLPSIIHLATTEEDSSSHEYTKLEWMTMEICKLKTKAWLRDNKSKCRDTFIFFYISAEHYEFHPLSGQIKGHNRDHWWFHSAKTHTYKVRKWEDCDSHIKESQGQEFGAQLLREQQKYHALSATEKQKGFRVSDLH